MRRVAVVHEPGRPDRPAATRAADRHRSRFRGSSGRGHHTSIRRSTRFVTATVHRSFTRSSLADHPSRRDPWLRSRETGHLPALRGNRRPFARWNMRALKAVSLLAWRLPWRRQRRRRTAARTTIRRSHGTGGVTPIQHLVVIFQENVSFDHYFGDLPERRQPATSRRSRASRHADGERPERAAPGSDNPNRPAVPARPLAVR